MAEDNTESTDGQNYLPHRKLLQIASLANNFLWIVLFVNTLFVFARFVEGYNTFTYVQMTAGDPTTVSNYWVMLSKNPLYLFSLIIDLINIFLGGLVFAIVLKGVSLGLNMIVETNINQQKTLEEENHG